MTPGEPPQRASYEYDVFLSYHRGERIDATGRRRLARDGQWVHEVFYPVFTEWLDHNMDQAPKIAFDEDMTIGTPWEDRLGRWHKASRILVAIWSAPYFRSSMCRSEWLSMLAREEQLDRAGTRRGELVFPIVYWDGDSFDPEAQGRQHTTKLMQFSHLRKGQEGSGPFQEFEQTVRTLCGAVKRAIDEAPRWQPDFPWNIEPPMGPARMDVPTLR